MTTPTLRRRLYFLVVVVAPFVTLAFGHPAPVLIAVPAAALLVYGLVARPGPPPHATAHLGTNRTLEGQPVEVRIEVEASGGSAHLLVDGIGELEVANLVGASQAANGLVIPLQDGAGEARLQARLSRWGNYRPGAGRVMTRGPGGMWLSESTVSVEGNLVVLPDLETTRRLVRPEETNLHSGDLVSRARGAGSELADLRPFAPGDAPRAINWRASARTDRLWVTERHAERNGDVVMLVDSLVGAGTTLETAVVRVARVAASLLGSYASARHRLGLLSVGGVVRWIGLDGGAYHEYRLLEGIMATQAHQKVVWEGVGRVIDRVVRPPSMLFAVSPLLDEELLGHLMQLGSAGLDVAVVGIDVSHWLDPRPGPVGSVARDIWKLERDRTIDHLRQAGVAVAMWSTDRSLEAVMEEVEEWRRHARRARI